MIPLWTQYLEDAIGVFSKRECPGDRFECRGSVKTAVINNRRVYLFIPHDPSLYPVEAVAV